MKPNRTENQADLVPEDEDEPTNGEAQMNGAETDQERLLEEEYNEI